MEVFQHTFTQMLMLFAIMLCGFIARKKRMTDDLFDGNLSKLVMSITLPATILNSVLTLVVYKAVSNLITPKKKQVKGRVSE